MEKTMFIRPRLSEKAFGLSQARTYVVEVPTSANKDMVAKAMAAQFGVAVATVNIIVAKGKPKRTVRKGGRPTFGKRSDIKKAYVTLQEGHSLPFFDEVEAEAKAVDKKTEKKDKKETK
jgi:large subunit ribosomal protein L23